MFVRKKESDVSVSKIQNAFQDEKPSNLFHGSFFRAEKKNSVGVSDGRGDRGDPSPRQRQDGRCGQGHRRVQGIVEVGSAEILVNVHLL